MSTAEIGVDLSKYKLGWSDEEDYVFKPEKGLNTGIIEEMSWMKGEPDWMRKFRMKSYDRFLKRPMPSWGGDMGGIDFDDIFYYIKPSGGVQDDWDAVPDAIKDTYEKLGIPEAERKYLAGVTAQYECLRGDQRVYTTTRGLVPIKEIASGDEVFSLNERTGELEKHRVKHAAQTDVRQTYRVAVGGRFSREIVATDNHPVLCLVDVRSNGASRARWQRQWKTIGELVEGDLVAVARDLPDFGESREQPVGPDLMRQLGEWLAGAANQFDDAHLARRVPDYAYGLPGEERLAIIGGYRAAGQSQDISVIQDIAELVRISERVQDEACADSVAAHMTNTLGWARVTEIEEADIAPVYDIEIDGPHNFVAEGLIVHNSEVVYHKNREDLEEQGVIFCDMDTALREHPEIVKAYFGKIIPPNDNKFSSLNSAVWSGGSFIYVPPGVHVEMPLQAYFRINAENMGQFERTLIIADEGSSVHYIEGCSAPVYSTDSLHSAVVEIIVKKAARVTYTTIQNWSSNVYNLVTKRAVVEEEGHMEWIDGNIGSRLTMKYPAVVMVGPKASGEVLSVAYAGPGQHQDAGAKMTHAAPETTSKIVSKSISKGGGRTSYRGLIRVEDDAYGCKSHVQCDALLLDDESISDTYPYMEVGSGDAIIGHEATVSKVADDQLFYLMSRGLTEEQAMGMVVNGFIEPITRTLPMEYAVEWSRLIELQMEGSVG